MCILFIAIEQHQDYPLVIAANRDEFYNRPTEASQFWSDNPKILAGRDLQSGGTWMGINTDGYLAALTNFRAPHMNKANMPSRGFLVSDYLNQPDQNYDAVLDQSGSRYNGFNLLYGHWSSLSVFNNVSNTHNTLTKGVYGLSNANLDTPWPKLTSGIDALSQFLTHHRILDPNELFTILSDTRLAADNELPDTGISADWEKALSSVFINLETYGTRSSTVLLINNNAEVYWCERSFDNEATLVEESEFKLTLMN